MTQELTLTPVRVGTGTEDEEGRLVFAGGRLVAVLVQLAKGHEAAGHWFLEHGFGRLDVTVPPTFSDLQAAERWIVDRLNGAADGHGILVAFPGSHTSAPGLLRPRNSAGQAT